MFVILLNYKKPLEVVDQHYDAHKEFIDECFKNNYFIMSGPKNPRTGGVIISPLKDRAQVEQLIKQDPFHVHGVAEYEVVEFVARKYHENLAMFV